MKNTRKDFIKKSALGLAGVAVSANNASSLSMNFNNRKATSDDWLESTPEAQGVDSQKLKVAV